MYVLASLSKLITANPIITPIRDTKFTTPLHNTVCASENLLLSKTATSPNYLGISCAMMAIITGTISKGFAVAKATPKARPSIKL